MGGGKTPIVSKADQHEDRFGGKLVLVLLDNKLRPSIRGGRSLWALFCPLVYTTGNMNAEKPETITIPAGFVTDLASIPRWAWVLLPPDGPWVKAATVHDYLYFTAGTGCWYRHPPSISRDTAYSREEADKILLEAMVNGDVGPVARTLIYWAVRVGGGPGWGPDAPRRTRLTEDDGLAGADR